MLRQPIFQSPYPILGPWMQRLDDLRVELDQKLHYLMNRKKLMLESHQKQVQALKPTNRIAHFRIQLNQWDRNLQKVILSKIIQLKKSMMESNENLNRVWRTQNENRRKILAAPAKCKQLDQKWLQLRQLRQERLKKIQETLQAIDPKSLLAKGYSILFSEKDHSVINSIKNVKIGDDIRFLLSDGEALTTAKKVFPK